MIVNLNYQNSLPSHPSDLQTDVSDLFGGDLPVEGGAGGRFAWRDGPLLQVGGGNDKSSYCIVDSSVRLISHFEIVHL